MAQDQLTPAQSLLQRFPGIRMRLHADRIPGRDQGLYHRVLTTPQELGALFTSTKATPRRADVSLAALDGHPMRVAELAARLQELRPSTRQPFDEAVAAFQDQRTPIELDVPVYALDDGQYLLLDGNHRAVGLFRSARPFTLRLWALKAPIRRRYLIDLKYWDRPGSTRMLRAMLSWKRALVIAIAGAFAADWLALAG